MGRSISYFSVLLLVSVLWKPAYTNDKCSLGCKGGTQETTFLSGHKYNYGVEGTVSVYLTGADNKETSVKLLGQVAVTSLGNCVNELSVQTLAISGPDGKKYQAPPGIEKPILFTLQDGKTGSEICAEEGDTRRSLNIKRAIVSLLQTEQKSSTQTDVFGVCPTDASFSKEGGAVLVHRTRDLSRCAHREQGKNPLVTAIYNPTAEIKSTQVLQSVLNVESKVNNGVPEKVAANEEYLYKPFSVGENGARAKVHTKLTLTGKAAGAASHKCTQTRTIIFENPHGETSTKSNANAVLTVVRDTAKAVNKEASYKSAGLFAQVIRIMRTASKDDLTKIFTQVKGNPVEKRVFLDGLFRAGTGASVEASIAILKQGQLSKIEEEVFFLTLAGTRHVTNDALRAAATLCDRPNPKNAYIGLGALAGIYCREYDCHSVQSSGITELSQKLGSKLNCRAKDKSAEDEAVFILKGIRNIHHLEDSLIDKVMRCASDNGVKPRVRSAALEAYQADACNSKVKKSALDLMKNRQLDSEIRIKAYLAVITCPCGMSANEIRKLLDTEPVHQVGRFISTSLRHIKASTNPDKQLARVHYGNIRPPNKFNVDDRKYSHYREASFNVDALGIGGNVEQTVIYSQDSFLPRSVSVNLTAEVFGHSLNVLEIGGRQGNLDRVAEHFFGPKSVLRTKSPQDIYDEIKKTYMDAKSETDAHLTRGRRSVKNDVDNFDKHLKDEAEPYNNELELDVYLKMFGTDALYLSFGEDKSFDFHQFIKSQLALGDVFLDKMKSFQHELRTHLLFLDAELAYPTSTGFPLKLDLIGSATARLDIGANVDIRQILRSPQNAKVDIKLVPSTDVEIAGIFLVDADPVATGLKVVTNLHSSTGGHVIAKVLENGNGFDLQLDMQEVDKQEILTASHDLVYFTAEKGQMATFVPLKTNADSKDYTGCFDQLSEMLGLTLCAELTVPFSVSGPEAQASVANFFSRYPLAGMAKVKLVLVKNDLRGYHIKGIYRNNNEKRSMELLFEAEGSKNRRTQLSGEIVNSQYEKSILLSLESPVKNLLGEVSLFTKPASEFSLMLKGKIDNALYYAKAGFTVQGNDRRSVFRPLVEYELPEQQGKKSLKIDGEVIREINQPVVKYTLQGVKVHMPNAKEVVDINGHFSQSSGEIDLDLKAKQGDYNLLLSGSWKGHDVKVEFQNNLNPFVNFRVNGHFENGETSYHNDIDLTYGGDLSDPNSRVVFNQLLKYHSLSADKISVITKNKFEILAVPLKLKLDAEADPKKIDIDFEGQYADRKGEFELEARTYIKKPGDYMVKIGAGLDNQGIEAFAKRDIVNTDKSNFENYIEIKNVGKYELSGVVLHKKKPNDVNVGAVGHLKVSSQGKNEDIKFDFGAVVNSKLYSSHAKISYSKGDFLDFLLKVTQGANSNGQLKLILKDTISANGQFKVTDNDGKGNGMIIVDFKQSQRKLKGDVKFVVKEPIYNAEIDVYLNFEKDNNDKIHFSTNTKKTSNLLDTKNKLQYAGKTSEVNVYAAGSLEGKSRANVEVVLPTERCLTLAIDRDITSKDDTYNGHAEIVLSDAEKRGGTASKLVYKAKVVDSNMDKNTYHYDGELDLQLRNGKQLQNAFMLKNYPKGDKFNFEFKSDLRGNMVPKPASFAATVLYNSTNTALFDSNTQLKGNYGDEYSFVLNDIVQVEENKYDEKVDFSLRLPFEKAHDIKFLYEMLFVEENNQYSHYTFVESLQVDADTYKMEANGKFGLKDGHGKVKLLVPHNDPFTLEGTYKNDLEGEKKTADVELKTQYGKGKSASVALNARAEHQEYFLKFTGNAPQNEQLKKLELSVLTKNPTPDTVSALMIADADGRVYKSESLVVYSKANPVVDITYSSPSLGKKFSRVYLKGTSLSTTQGKIEVKIENIRDITLDLVTEGSMQQDNVVFKAVAKSAQLGLNDYTVDVSSKDVGGNKRLEFHAVNGGKNVLSGSTSFISKKEGTKTIIEGSGTVKVKEDQKSANFKYIRTVLTEGNEQGIETFLNVAIGERSYVAESRVTNLEYKTSYVYCEEKKQCANAEFHSKLNIQKQGVVQHVVNVIFDLRKLGIAPEFGLEVNSEMSESKLPQYSLDLHVNKEDKKYHLQVYSKPVYGRFPAGITVTLPHRVLAIESLVVYPTDKALPFPIKGELNMYPDKNKPNHKSGARFLVDVTGDEKHHAAIAEFAFSHPKLGKEALMKFKANVALPEKNCFKYESTATISHPTIGGNREGKVFFEVSPTKLKLYLETPLVKVVDVEGSATVQEKLQEANFRFSLLEGKPVQVYACVKDLQYYEFTTDESDRKLSVVGHLQPEKRVDISADILLGGEKRNIVHGALFIQDNNVKSDYGFSSDNFKYFVSALKKDLETLEQRIKQLGEKAGNDFKATLQRVKPTLEQLQKSYADDLHKLYDEISNDKVLKEISEVLDHIVKYVAKTIDDIIRVTAPMFDQINKVVTITAQKVEAMYKESIEPQLRQLYGTLSALIKELFDSLLDVVTHFAAIVIDIFEKHKAELQELANTISEIFKDLTRIVIAQLKELRVKSSAFFEDLATNIKNMPIFEMIKEKYQEMAVPDAILDYVKQLQELIEQIMPTPETKIFTASVYRYLEKKRLNEKVDENAELRILYQKFTKALTSLVQLVRAHLGQIGVPDISAINPFSFFSGPSQPGTPSFGGAPPGFSVLNQLINGEFDDPLAVLKEYRVRSLNPLEEYPSKLRAVIVNGQHIFTFDGRHLTFPGTCRYVLAHDFVDRNFTLAMQLQAGAPKSVVLVDKSGTTVELKDNGQVTVDGQNHGFPVMHGEDLYAYKEPNGLVAVGSKYGVKATCSPKLEVCYFEVSGFYLGKLRGLLGNGNNEPFDDFKLPNGKVSSSESEFGNSYRLASSCPQVKTPEHSHHQLHGEFPPACEQVFGGSSPLRPLSLLLDVAPFKQACVHAATGPDAIQQACDLARGYAVFAFTGMLPTVMPPVCLQCKDADKPRNVGDTYELKVPNKQADIIVAVETTISNEKSFKSLVLPLISQLVDNLKSKRITDIKVHLVGATSKFPYPIVYDTDLKLQKAKVRFDDKMRYDQTPVLKTGCKHTDEWIEVITHVIDELKIQLGLQTIYGGYTSIYELPIRAGAVQHTVYVVGEKCINQFFLIDAMYSAIHHVLFDDLPYTHSLVAVTPDLKVGGGKKVSQVVGFTEHNVLMLGDKKFGRDTESIRSTLENPSDQCIDFIESTGGLVFSATNYLQMNPDEQKQYVQTAAGAITQGMLKESLVQECTCTYVDPFRVRSVCVNKQRKEVARRRK